MASRFWSVSTNGNVKVKHRGVVGRVVPVKDHQGRVLKWDCYIGQRKIGSSSRQRLGAQRILDELGITEKSLLGRPTHR